MSNFFTEQLANMNLKDTFELINFIITIVIPIWGVLYIRKAKLYYLERNNIKLYEDITKNIEGISIKYKNEDVKENLILFGGTVILKSSHDIKKDDIDKEITISSPDRESEWRHFEILKCSADFEPSYKIVGNKVVIEKTLLKRNDYISFAGLLDSKNENLLVGHRIHNLLPKSINLKENEKGTYRKSALIYSFTTLFILLLAYLPNHIYNNEKGSSQSSSFVDSIGFETLYYDEIYFLNSKSVNLDSLDKVLARKDSIAAALEYNKKSLVHDSLMKIYQEYPNDKNQINVLRARLEEIRAGLKTPEYLYLTIKANARANLEERLMAKDLDTNKVYHLNDSISVKYRLKDFMQKQRIEDNASSYDTSTILFDSLVYIVGLLTVSFAVFCWYRYLILRSLTKLYLRQN